MRNRIITELQTEYEQQRIRNSAEEARRRSEAIEHCPGLGALLDERQNMIFSAIRSVLDGNGAAENLPERMAKVNDGVEALLTGHGYPADYLDPVYRCSKCQDSGYIGDTVRDMCTCMRSAFYERLYREVGLQHPEEESFEGYRSDVYSDALLENRNYSQRTYMDHLRDWCRDWSERYPDTPVRNILMIGRSGLGKTFMMHAMAKKLLEHGQNVLMISAYRFLEMARKAYFSDDETMEELLETDVLMIDDLGSEPLMENITVTQLFNLVNERQSTGKATVISTNLGEKALRERYTERIVSRLTDKRSSMCLHFEGEDVRRR